MASAVVGIIGFSNFLKVLRLYRFFKNLALKIVWTLLKGLWFGTKWLFCVGLPYPARATYKYACVPIASACCTPGSPLYACKQCCAENCTSCELYYHPYEKLEVTSN